MKTRHPLKAILQKLGATQAQLARSLGTQRSHVSAVLNRGRHKISWLKQTLDTLAPLLALEAQRFRQSNPVRRVPKGKYTAPAEVPLEKFMEVSQ